MTVVSFLTPKGGAGKSTSAILFGSTIAKFGMAMTFIDGDPNRTIANWSRLKGLPADTSLREDPNEDTILDTIEEAAAETPMVVIDLEGTASVMQTYAIGASDLIIIPLQASAPDFREAMKAVKLIRRQEKAANRAIPFLLAFTRTKAAYKTRQHKEIDANIRQAGLPILDVELIEREAFNVLHSIGGDLYGLPAEHAPNLPAAVENAEAFTKAIVRVLKRASAPAADAENAALEEAHG